MTYLYAIGLGSNRAHARHHRPRHVLAAALRALRPLLRSPIVDTRPLGPSTRTFANAAAIIRSDLRPVALLARLKHIEAAYGRRAGRRWGTRTLDLDILLWSGGACRSRALTIPHAQLLDRTFALLPLAAIAPHWRIPGGGTVRQHAARLTRPRPIHRSGRQSGL